MNTYIIYILNFEIICYLDSYVKKKCFRFILSLLFEIIIFLRLLLLLNFMLIFQRFNFYNKLILLVIWYFCFLNLLLIIILKEIASILKSYFVRIICNEKWFRFILCLLFEILVLFKIILKKKLILCWSFKDLVYISNWFP